MLEVTPMSGKSTANEAVRAWFDGERFFRKSSGEVLTVRDVPTGTEVRIFFHRFLRSATIVTENPDDA